MKHATPYERQFRVILKNIRSKVPNLKFSSQRIIYTTNQHDVFFVADFLIEHPKVIAIEIDGSSHRGRASHDAWRSRILQRLGIETIRFTNYQVSHNRGGIEYSLLQMLDNVGS